MELLEDERLEAFAARLKLVAQNFGSANALAKAAGVSQSGLHKWLSGAAEPGRGNLLAICRAAGVRLEWLAAGTGPMMATEDKDDSAAGHIDTIGALELLKHYKKLVNRCRRQLEENTGHLQQLLVDRLEDMAEITSLSARCAELQEEVLSLRKKLADLSPDEAKDAELERLRAKNVELMNLLQNIPKNPKS